YPDESSRLASDGRGAALRVRLRCPRGDRPRLQAERSLERIKRGERLRGPWGRTTPGCPEPPPQRFRLAASPPPHHVPKAASRLDVEGISGFHGHGGHIFSIGP